MEEKNKFYFDDEDEVVKKKKKKKKKHHSKKVNKKVNAEEKQEVERGEINYTYVFIALLAFGVLIVGLGAIYAHSQNGKRDWDNMNGTVVENPIASSDYDDGAAVFADSDNSLSDMPLKSIVLISNSKELLDCYRFEMYSDGNKLYFSCYYPTEESNIILTGEVIDKTRMTDVINTINRFTVAKKIKAYRSLGTPVEKDNEDNSQSLQITWNDGDTLDVGYPNGAGKAVEKYFKELAIWINNSN